jgi:hypothetical protein
VPRDFEGLLTASGLSPLFRSALRRADRFASMDVA